MRRNTKTGLPRHSARICSPGRIFEISTFTGAPAAFAFALGFQEETKGVATPTAPTALSAAVAPTKNNDRIEWFVEKSTEIGINSISTVLCEKSERKKVKTERLEKITISAMKQSLQLHKPIIEELVSFEEFTRNCKSDNKFIAHCKESEKLFLNNCKIKAKTITVLIGPEGGFSDNEIDIAEKNGFISVSLGNNRLRTETAAIAATQILSTYNIDI